MLKFLLELSILFVVCLAHESVFQSVGENHACNLDQGATSCIVDGYVGSTVIYEDEKVRVWNFTLAPGAMTSMHRHDNDYHYVAIQPTQLQVWGENGSILFDFRAEGAFGFRVEGEYLIPTSESVKLPFDVPRTHSAKNIGPNTYYEILYESKSAPNYVINTQDNEL
jgi:hypothetical protein